MILEIILFAPSVALIAINIWIDWGYRKGKHSASPIGLVGGAWAMICALALFKQWWAIFFLAFDYVFIITLLVFLGVVKIPEIKQTNCSGENNEN